MWNTDNSKNEDYYIINALDIFVQRQQSRAVDFELQIREFGKVWRTKYYYSMHSSGGGNLFPLKTPVIVPKNSDIRVNATSSGAGTGVSASIHGVLAKIV